MNPFKRIVVRFSQSFEETLVLFVTNFVLWSQPDGFIVIDVDPFCLFLFDGFLLLFLLVLIIIVGNFDFIFLILSAIFLFFAIIVVSDFLCDFSEGSQVDWEIDELAVLLDEVLDGVFFSEFLGILLQEDDDLGATTEGVASRVRSEGERVGSAAFPDPLGVIHVAL